MVQLIFELTLDGSCGSPFCFKQWISAVVLIPSSMYFFRTIGNYDEQLREKKQRHQEEVESLIENINQQVKEMNELCRQITENANEFATGRFNDKCDQFSRFLKGVKNYNADLYVDADMFEEMKNFILGWFKVFSGSLINPAESPMVRGIEEEVRRCTTIQALCDAALVRLGSSKVAFKMQVPAETPMLTPAAQRGVPSFTSLHAIEDGTARSGGQDATYLCGVSWCQCGRWRGCRREWGRSSNSMPLSIFCCCCKFKILSRQHFNLIVAFFIDIGLMVFEVATDRWTSLILVAINEICIISMLACFEQINEIALLEQQIHVYEMRNVEVGKRRDEARENWEKVQQLHDLWLYRTLPSLSIMGKIQHYLADQDLDRKNKLADGHKPADERATFLRLANQSLDCLDRKLGPIDDWRSNGPLAEGWKESIGKQLKDCEAESDLHQLIGRLPIITSDLSALEAAPPSMTPNASPSQSPTTSFM